MQSAGLGRLAQQDGFSNYGSKLKKNPRIDPNQLWKGGGAGFGAFSTARGFFQLWLESQKDPEIRPKPIVDVERPVSRVEINAKNAPLTPASPHRRLLTHFLRPRAVKNALTRPTQSYTVNILEVLLDGCLRVSRARESSVIIFQLVFLTQQRD